jgi:hypothetical protein
VCTGCAVQDTLRSQRIYTLCKIQAQRQELILEELRSLKQQIEILSQKVANQLPPIPPPPPTVPPSVCIMTTETQTEPVMTDGGNILRFEERDSYFAPNVGPIITAVRH